METTALRGESVRRARRHSGHTILPAESPVREAEYAARWEAGWWRGRVLRTERGDLYTVVYQGRRGGGAGPDFRDAVLVRPDGARIHGDVELHLRAADWRTHGHDTDRRYAGVVLHIVFSPLPAHSRGETPLPMGGSAPIAVLDNDYPGGAVPVATPWPCTGLASRLDGARLRSLLLEAGRARFARRETQFMREIAAAEAVEHQFGIALWTPRDRTLFVAIAEALGYGRDRDALRAVGESLVGFGGDAGGGAVAGGRVERARVSGLLDLRERWLADGPWSRLGELVARGTPRGAARATIGELRVDGGRISAGRAAIVAANVVLPFASALAALAGDDDLCVRALAVFDALPGLPSNAITRLMARQHGMRRLPAGAAAQQGLQHIWTTWCREKRCASCPCASASATWAIVAASSGET